LGFFIYPKIVTFVSNKTKKLIMEPISMALAGAGLAAKAYGGVQSYRNQRKMEGQLRDLQKTPMARFTIDPKVRDMYAQSISEASTPEGYGGATISNFRQGIGRNIRGRFRNALSVSGGSGSRGINAVLNSQGMDAYNQFAQGDEGIRRSNRNMGLNRSMNIANQFQSARDRNTSFNQNYRLQTERALGEGIRSQRDYRTNMITGAGSDLLTAGLGYGDNFALPERPTYSRSRELYNLI
jgi:hypothetical protein